MPSGYWKVTGSPSYVYSAPANRVIGEKRTMVFYEGRAPTGNMTRWKMNEYKVSAATNDDRTIAAANGAPPLLAAGAPFRVCTRATAGCMRFGCAFMMVIVIN
jgi:hypothetical protein